MKKLTVVSFAFLLLLPAINGLNVSLMFGCFTLKLTKARAVLRSLEREARKHGRGLRHCFVGQ